MASVTDGDQCSGKLANAQVPLPVLLSGKEEGLEAIPNPFESCPTVVWPWRYEVTGILIAVMGFPKA